MPLEPYAGLFELTSDRSPYPTSTTDPTLSNTLSVCFSALFLRYVFICLPFHSVLLRCLLFRLPTFSACALLSFAASPNQSSPMTRLLADPPLRAPALSLFQASPTHAWPHLIQLRTHSDTHSPSLSHCTRSHPHCCCRYTRHSIILALPDGLSTLCSRG